MLSTIILVTVGFHLICGLPQRQSQIQTVNLRTLCLGQHSGSKYKITCDGRKHFKDKNLFLGSQSIVGMTDIELDSIDNITILNQLSSDWDEMRSITIKRSKKVILIIQSVLNLDKLQIDSVDELTVEAEQPSSSINIKTMTLSNVGKLTMTSSKNTEIKASMLSLSNVKDVSLFRQQLQFLGDKMVISGSNIDVMDHSTVILKFPSIIIEESSKLYIQKDGQSNVSTDTLLIKDSYIYTDGCMNIAGYESEGSRKEIEFFKNLFYGISKSHLQILGSRNEMKFVGNGIYNSDMEDVLELVGEIENVTFTNNKFGCNKCPKKQVIQAKYLEHLGEQNFCDLSCDLTLSIYKELLDQEKICSLGGNNVEEEELCTVLSKPITTSSSNFVWWFLIPIIVIVLIFLIMLLCFYCKSHSARFQAMPVENAVVLPVELKTELVNKELTVRAFSNEVYGRAENISENLYEIVDPLDPPTSIR